MISEHNKDERRKEGRLPEDENLQGSTLRPDEGSMDVPDLDGDGMIGSTGGFYGGTSYLGSNFGPGWEDRPAGSEQNEGNFGAAGQRDDTELTRPDAEENSSK